MPIVLTASPGITEPAAATARDEPPVCRSPTERMRRARPGLSARKPTKHVNDKPNVFAVGIGETIAYLHIFSTQIPKLSENYYQWRD